MAAHTNATLNCTIPLADVNFANLKENDLCILKYYNPLGMFTAVESFLYTGNRTFDCSHSVNILSITCDVDMEQANLLIQYSSVDLKYIAFIPGPEK